MKTMFPPFPQEKAAKILEKLIESLEKGEISLIQVARPSEERKNQGVMLGALVCKDKNGEEVNLVTNSGNAKKLAISNEKAAMCNEQLAISNEQLAMRNEKLGVSNEQVAISNEELGVRNFFEGENSGTEEKKFVREEEKFQFSPFNFQFVSPIVSNEEIEEALAENDKEIHEITEKIKSGNGKLKSGHELAGDGLGEEDNSISDLRKLRERLCGDSLEKVHALYKFHCIDGKVRTLKEICALYNGGKLPPTGTGDCCAPKLLDYAFAHELIPISLAETAYNAQSGRDCWNPKNLPVFWVPTRKFCSPKGKQNFLSFLSSCLHAGQYAEPRKGRKKLSPETISNSSLLIANSTLKTPNLIPPCDERCGILLPAMLGLRILWRDEAICVVNKQSGLLSVPGRGEDKQDCIESRFRRLFGDKVEIKQPAVHRLDMETSGIMILAFTKEAHRELNRQFEAKEVQKEYVALLDGILPKMGIARHGTMELFFRLDVDNRPHQIWDSENGKSAVTEWEILGVERYHAPDGSVRNATRVLFMPHTGRTHQLRLASADSHGFGCPIIGDTLYGHCEEGERLMLHAKKISFTHPVTGERMIFECESEF